jgi:hypothetical protein
MANKEQSLMHRPPSSITEVVEGVTDDAVRGDLFPLVDYTDYWHKIEDAYFRESMIYRDHSRQGIMFHSTVLGMQSNWRLPNYNFYISFEDVEPPKRGEKTIVIPNKAVMASLSLRLDKQEYQKLKRYYSQLRKLMKRGNGKGLLFERHEDQKTGYAGHYIVNEFGPYIEVVMNGSHLINGYRGKIIDKSIVRIGPSIVFGYLNINPNPNFRG